MLINLILTCTIFFTFYSSLRTVSAYQAIKQYETTYEAYENSFINHIYETNKTIDENYEWADAKKLSEDFDTAYEYINNEENQVDETFNSYQTFVNQNLSLIEDATEIASQKAIDTWNDNKDSWLWVQNIWVIDAPTNIFPTYGELKSAAANAGGYYNEYVTTNINEIEYNKIAGLINSNSNSQNGFYLLAILAGVITFLSQYISDLHNKLKNKKANNLANAANPQAAKSMKIMKFVMPVIMVMFVISSSASFGIYLLASNIAGIAFGELINLFVNISTKKKRIEVESYLEKEADRLIRKGKLQG